jgi:hypothetical protein
MDGQMDGQVDGRTDGRTDRVNEFNRAYDEYERCLLEKDTNKNLHVEYRRHLEFLRKNFLQNLGI